MADRNSAEIFGMIFEYLGQHEHPHIDGYGNETPAPAVQKFWAAQQRFDFSNEQLGCDDALIKLGLARWAINSDGDQEIEYRGPDGIAWRGL